MLRKAPGIKVEVFDKLGSLMLMAFNFYHPPFDNVKLRRAVMSAINQQELVNSVGGEQQNLGRVGVGVFPLASPYSTTAGTSSPAHLSARFNDAHAVKRFHLRHSSSVLAGTQLGHRAKLGWQRRPPRDAPGARSRLRVVGDSWEPPAQLDNGRQLSLLIEDGADSGGIGFGDDEHPQSMVVSTTACKRDVRCLQAWQRPRRANRFELL